MIVGSETNGNIYSNNSEYSENQSSPHDLNERITPDKLPDELGLKKVRKLSRKLKQYYQSRI